MKTYVLMLSQVFPADHPRAGEPTYFEEKVLCGLGKSGGFEPKIHTMRSNYQYWKDRFDLIDKGEACLSIRKWSGKPYRSKTIEIARLTKEDGIGLQKANIRIDKEYGVPELFLENGIRTSAWGGLIATRDGLTPRDWCSWFQNHDPFKPIAIIQFTKFRY